jgi:hypothetical protein
MNETLPTGAATRTPAAAPSVRSRPVTFVTATAAPEDGLEKEAALVAEARGALRRGDAAGALQRIRAARAIPSGELAPEELSIEVQALKALGRSDDAAEADARLRSSYPESALAR